MMSKKILILLAIVTASVTGFSQKEPLDSSVIPGHINIKFRPAMVARLQVFDRQSSRVQNKFGIPEIDKLTARYQVEKISKSFEVALANKQYEQRHQQSGFHLWYSLQIPDSLNAKEVARVFAALKEMIDVAEPEYKKVLNAWTPNDPRYNQQWHYHNTGQNSGTADADIDLPEAWDIEKGDSSVIVAVHDGGVDTTHPDLRQNLWRGRGYNFVTNSSSISPEDHGCHVSGTIAAVNNNGIGVSGIAGGDGSPGTGVRIMNTQVYAYDAGGYTISAGTAGHANAYIWAADHGAAISQNSWGYNVAGNYEQMVLDAIDYFIEYGGGSILKKGLVIFSGGNKSISAYNYPGAYEHVISVAATNNQDKKSYYSNYGNQLDISAPGGESLTDSDSAKNILSTVSVAGGSYEFYQGTSMAAPHVSGVAALIISKGKGRFSADDVKEILLSQTDNHYSVNSAYIGQLGTGRLNAYKCLQKTVAIIADPLVEAPDGFTATKNGCNITLQWARNSQADGVMIAVSADSTKGGYFGLPYGNTYSVNQRIDGKGLVVYKGSGTSFTYPAAGGKYYFKIWSVNAQGKYSMGITNGDGIRITGLLSATATPVSFSRIDLAWSQSTCFNNEVIITSQTNEPAYGSFNGGMPSVGDSIAGIGKVIYRGTGTGFSHTGLAAGTYYYYTVWAMDASGLVLDRRTAVAVTPCSGQVYALPFSDEFNAVELNTCKWQSVIVVPGSVETPRLFTDVITDYTSVNPAEGRRMLAFNSFTNSGGRIRLTSKPLITTGIAHVNVAFQWLEYNAADLLLLPGEGVTVQWSTDGVTWRNVQQFDRWYTGAVQGWKYKEVMLPDSAGNQASIYIGLLFTSRSGLNCYLDAFSVHRTPGRLYVDKDVAAPGGGYSWSSAYKTLPDALSYVNKYNYTDTIFVAGGTYYPTANSSRDSSFRILRNGIKLFGSFAGTEANLSERNLSLNPTILSGNIGTGGSSDNSNHVLTVVGTPSANIDGNTRIDGFTITGGKTDGDATSFTVKGQPIPRGNGAGIYLYGEGAGNKCSPYIANCRFIADTAGGGGTGGALFANGSASGISSPVLLNCVFAKNRANTGGAIYNYTVDNGNCSPSIINCVFSANSAANGGAIFNSGLLGAVSGYITNCTFVQNSASDAGGAIFNTGLGGVCNPLISNSIFRSNTAVSAGADIFNENATPSVNYCITQVYGTNGVNNNLVGADPKFANPADPDGPDNIWGTADDGLKLGTGSAALNSGNNGLISSTITTDITGAVRIQGGTIDRGAYENASLLTVWTGTISTNWQVAGNWTNGVPDAAKDVIIALTANQPILTADARCRNISLNANTRLMVGTYKLQVGGN